MSFYGANKKISADGDKYQSGDITVYNSPSKLFFKKGFINGNKCIFIDGYLVVNEDISDSQKRTMDTLMYLMKAYQEKGISNLIEKIKTGIFNLVLCDGEKIFIVNDRMGLNPLYYTIDDGFSFSSTIKLLDGKGIDWVAISEYLRYGYVLGDKTQYKNIKRMSPSSIIIFDGKLKIEQHTNLAKFYDFNPSSIVGIKNNLCKAIDRICSFGNRYEMHLSGGLDSRLILANWDADDLFITRGNDNSEDVIIAKKLAKKYNFRHEIRRPYKSKGKFFLDRVDNFLDCRKMSALLKEKKPIDKLMVVGKYSGEILGGEWLWNPSSYYKGFKQMIKPTLHKYRESDSIAKDIQLGLQSKITDENLRTILMDDTYESLVDPLEHIKSMIFETPYVEISNELFHIRNLQRRFGSEHKLCPFLDYDLIRSILSYPAKKRMNRRLIFDLYRKYFRPWCGVRATNDVVPLYMNHKFHSYAHYAREIRKRHFSVAKKGLESVSYEMGKNQFITDEMKRVLLDSAWIKTVGGMNKNLMFRLYCIEKSGVVK